MIAKGGFPMTKLVGAIVIVVVSLTSSFSVFAQNTEGRFPKLANMHLAISVRNIDVFPFSLWDLMILARQVDNSSQYRSNVQSIKDLNPDEIFLLYSESTCINTNLNPPDPVKTAADEYNWWLRDYQGEPLYYLGWEYAQLLNMTNTVAASGSHPTGMRANEYIPQILISDHIMVNSYWNGIFYDTFSNTLSWMYPNIKDATGDAVPEFDNQHNGNQPLFTNLWNLGMVTLASETRERGGEDLIIIGNGANTSTLSYLNGKFIDNYTRNNNLDNLINLCNFLERADPDPKIGIINGANINADPTDYLTMRFALGSALLIGAYFSFDFGAQYHSEYLWFDEYTIKPDGEVAAVTTTLNGDVTSEAEDIPVLSTEGFTDYGLIWIEGELIYYNSKDDTIFKDCYRGYPAPNPNYDLRASHANNSIVVQYDPSYKGYLGTPLSEAYDINDNDVKLVDLLLDAGWWGEGPEIENIDSRVWRRDFEHGSVIVNPTSSSKIVENMGEGQFIKIKGIQDPNHNDGELVSSSIEVGSKDSYILIRNENSHGDDDAPSPPQGLTIIN